MVLPCVGSMICRQPTASVTQVRSPHLYHSYDLLKMPKSRRGCCAGARECIFCHIVKEADAPASRVIYQVRAHVQDDQVLVVPDIRPAAAVHLLVLPKVHIANVSSLGPSDATLIRHMAAVGERVLREQDRELQLAQPTQHKFGFHKPPFRSVDQLHLHCFTLPHKWYRWVQYCSDLNWVTADQLIDQLTRMPTTT